MHANSLNSEFFMNDPVEIKSNEFKNKGFVSKGDTKENSYEHKGGDGDIFIIKSNNESFELSRNTLKEALIQLKEESNKEIQNLNGNNTESFRSIVETLHILYDIPELYNIIIKDIRNIFEDIKVIKPGTVSAFFLGCSSNDNFTGPLGCNPKCVSSLKPPKNELESSFSECNNLVLIYNTSSDSFNSINDKTSSHVYIFISDTTFTGFSKDNISQLENAQIKTVTLIYGEIDGSYKEISSPMAITDLPYKQLSNNSNNSNNLTDNPNSNNTINGITIIFIISIILLIILIIVLYRSNMISN